MACHIRSVNLTPPGLHGALFPPLLREFWEYKQVHKDLGKNDGNYCSVSCHLDPDRSVLKWMQILFQPENLWEFFEYWLVLNSQCPLVCIHLIESRGRGKAWSFLGWKKRFCFTSELLQCYASATQWFQWGWNWCCTVLALPMSLLLAETPFANDSPP